VLWEVIFKLPDALVRSIFASRFLMKLGFGGFFSANELDRKLIRNIPIKYKVL
jgi:hypothetical protein